MTQSNMQAAFIAELQKKVEAQANEFKVVQEQLKALTTKAADPKPADSTAPATEANTADTPSTPKRAARPRPPRRRPTCAPSARALFTASKATTRLCGCDSRAWVGT